MRAVVVGAGVIGLSLARSLLRAGHSVRVYDKAQVPNPHASSVDRSRLIRYAYGGQLGYAAMVDDAYAAWERLWDELGRKHYRQTGTLVLAQRGSSWAQDCAATLSALGRPVEWLTPAAAQDRFPLLELGGIEALFHVWSGGVLEAEAIVAALAARVRALGGHLHEKCPVAGVDTERARLDLADGTRVEADLLVLAPGPWAARLVPDLAERLTPSRQLVCYAEIPPSEWSLWAVMPMVLDIGKDSGFYAVPPVFGQPLKVGDHGFTMQGDPERERNPGADELQRLFEGARGRIRDLDSYRIVEGRTCFYTVEPNEQFVVERRGRTWVFAGFSGHGFKFGPLIGERFAEVLAGRIAESAFTRWTRGEDRPARRTDSQG